METRWRRRWRKRRAANKMKSLVPQSQTIIMGVLPLSP